MEFANHQRVVQIERELPSWRHQRALAAVFRTIDPFVRVNGLGCAIVGPAAALVGHDTYIYPDLFVVRHHDQRSEPLLVVQVVSPDTACSDRVSDRLLAQAHEVPEYWVVDVDSEVIERWRRDNDRPEIATSVLEWRPVLDAPRLLIDVEELFRE